MKNFFKWLLVAYAIAVPLIILGSYISPLSALVIWLAYMPACGIGLLLLNIIYKACAVPVSVRAPLHVLMAVGLFVYPTWDGFVGKYYLTKMCEMDGGVYFKAGVNIDSVYIPAIKANVKKAIFGDESNEAISKRYKRTFDSYKDNLEAGIFEVPAKDVSGKYVRFLYGEKGSFSAEIVDSLISNYIEDSISTARSYAAMHGSVIPGIYLGYIDSFYQNRSTNEKVFGFKNYIFIYTYDRYLTPLGSAPYMDCKALKKGDPKFNNLKKFEYLEK